MCIISEEAKEAITDEDIPIEVIAKPPLGEICIVSSPSIIISLEMEIGNETIPVLVMQASLTGQAKDWSSEVSISITILKNMGYKKILLQKQKYIVKSRYYSLSKVFLTTNRPPLSALLH